MAKVVLLDSGPLVAALRKRDHYHQWALGHFQNRSQPFLTCDAVFPKAFLAGLRAPGKGAALWHAGATTDRE